MKGLMLHCGGQPATIADLGQIPLPERTKTYTPVPFDYFANLVLDEIEKAGLTVRQASWGLNHNHQQMFGYVQTEAEHKDAESALSFGLRSSHDQSMSNGLVGGASVFVCDNLMISGSDFRVMRKHTGNALEELVNLVTNAVRDTTHGRKVIEARISALQDIEITTRQGCELLGSAVGQRLFTGKQTNRAFGQWKEPKHDAFLPRTMWSLYNAGTEALKLGPVRGVINRHTSWDAFVRDAGAAAWGEEGLEVLGRSRFAWDGSEEYLGDRVAAREAAILGGAE